MRARTWLIVGAAVVLLGVAGVAAGAGLLVWRERSLPVYTMVQERAPDGEGVIDTLTLDGVRYVQGLPEFALDPLGRGGQVGKTADGMRVHALAGAGSKRDYLILTGFMFPDIVYRRADVPVFDPLSASISEVRLLTNAGLGPRRVTSRDPALIAEVLSRLGDPGAPTAAREPYETYRIDLLSPQAPGVSYLLYVAVAADGKVYLAERATPEAWRAAGPTLAQWLQEAIGRPDGLGH